MMFFWKGRWVYFYIYVEFECRAEQADWFVKHCDDDCETTETDESQTLYKMQSSTYTKYWTNQQ